MFRLFEYILICNENGFKNSYELIKTIKPDCLVRDNIF